MVSMVCFGSGMAAISAVIMLLDKGDHLVLNSDVYGGTYRALTKEVFTRFGIDVDLLIQLKLKTLNNILNLKLKCYIETPSNPLLRVTDIKASAKIAKI